MVELKKMFVKCGLNFLLTGQVGVEGKIPASDKQFFDC